MSTLIVDAIQGLADPTYALLPTGICDPACLDFEEINGALRLTIKKNSLDGSFFTGDFIPDGSITSRKIANGAVGTDQLADGAVTTSKLADHCVTQIKLAFGAVTNTEIASGTILSSNLAPNAVVTNTINNSAVTNSKLAAGCITTSNLTPAVVANANLQAACISIDKLGDDVKSLIATASALPAGTIIPSARTAPTTGFLFCDGSQVPRNTYAALYAALGGVNSPWGQGDGSTTFHLPDLRGRFPMGAGAAPGLTARSLGDRGGNEKHTLSIAEMPYHNHHLVDGGHQHPITEAPHSHATAQTPHYHPITDKVHTHYINTAQGQKYVQGSYSYYGAGCIEATFGPTAIVAGPTGITNTENASAIISVVENRIGLTTTAGSYSGLSQIYPTGSSAPHDIMNPFAAINYFIKT